MKNSYQYGIGRARSLEAHLLTSQQIERMAGAEGFEAAFTVLTETPYAETLPKLKQAFDFEELYQLEMIALEKLLLNLSLNNPVMVAIFEKREYATNPFAVDQHYFANLQKVCAVSQSPLIQNFVKHKIDAINLKSLLRSRDKEELKAAFITGGLLDLELITALFGKGLEEIASRLSFSPYFPAIKTTSPHLFERQLDDFILNQFKRAKYLASGLEPLVGFYLAKELELKTIRFILICKKNHVKNKEIGERVRFSYA